MVISPPGMKNREDRIRQELERAAARSTCFNIRLGAVIETVSGELIAGWNGPPGRCGPHESCRVGGPITSENLSRCPGVHAEIRAICRAAEKGLAAGGGTIYLSQWYPCAPCARAVIEAGLRVLVVTEELSLAKDDCYNFSLARELLETAGVETRLAPALRAGGAVPAQRSRSATR